MLLLQQPSVTALDSRAQSLKVTTWKRNLSLVDALAHSRENMDSMTYILTKVFMLNTQKFFIAS